MSNDDNIFKLQQLLYQYIDSFEYRSLQSIYDACNNILPGQEKHSSAAWKLFYPLLYSGVVDFIGKDKYAITEPIILFNKKNYYYINCKPSSSYSITPFVGIVRTDVFDDTMGIPLKRMDAIQILKTIPSFKTIVESFPKVYSDEKFIFFESEWDKGLATINDGFARFFTIPELMTIRRVPNRETNPETSFRVPYCYSRAINDEKNGIYYISTKKLMMRRFAMPILVYRILLLNSFENDYYPVNEGEYVVFNNVSNRMASEMNRIFNNSINYE